jgi:hypothetical protein
VLAEELGDIVRLAPDRQPDLAFGHTAVTACQRSLAAAQRPASLLALTFFSSVVCSATCSHVTVFDIAGSEGKAEAGCSALCCRY